MIKSNVVDNQIHLGFNLYKLSKKILKRTSKILNIKTRHIMSYIFVDLEQIHRINKEYRQKDAPTDVISFAYVDAEPTGALPYELGDVFICKEKIIAQANEYQHSLLRECSFLMTHGILHLLGYNHEEKEEEKVMFDLQDRILNELKITR